MYIPQKSSFWKISIVMSYFQLKTYRYRDLVCTNVDWLLQTSILHYLKDICCGLTNTWWVEVIPKSIKCTRCMVLICKRMLSFKKRILTYFCFTTICNARNQPICLYNNLPCHWPQNINQQNSTQHTVQKHCKVCVHVCYLSSPFAH